MADVTTSAFSFTRSSAVGSGGAVAGKMSTAVDAGIDMLRQGGNAFDAAVATAFAMGVAEPWMNGIGGGGYMVGWLAEEGRSFTIEYPMISPLGATDDMFPLSGGTDASLFGWPRTVDNANVLGFRSIAVPGTVAGLCLALERYGSLSLATVMAPAITLAEDGVDVTWHTTSMLSKDLVNLRRFESTASIYLDSVGNPPFSAEGVPTPRLRNPELAATLRAIAEGGSDAFYRGPIARTMANYLQSHGTPISAEDFGGYVATEDPGLTTQFQGHHVHTIGKGTGGTSLVESLEILERLNIGDSTHNSPEALHKFVHAFRQAFADRFTYLGDPDHVEVPIAAILGSDYLDVQAARFDPERLASVVAGTREQLGVQHSLAGSVPEYMQDGSTTHLSVVDGTGNAVSLTQTLLSAWGSRVTVPGTGVLFNNGMMWFDPEPGRPNSVGPNKRPLTNMAPALMTRNGSLSASIGSSGGRKIMNCNAQLIANLAAFNLPMGEALAAPRIDASTSQLNVSARLSSESLARLEDLGHVLNIVDETLLAGGFASPVGITRADDGALEAAADAWYFPATAKAMR